MAITFTNIKKKLGVDDVLPFGVCRGKTVLETIEDQPSYIRYLHSKGVQFYPSVLIELARYRAIEDCNLYTEDDFYDIPF